MRDEYVVLLMAGAIESAPANPIYAARNAVDAITAAGFVVVACPPGSRVVVDRTPQPCEACDGMCFDGSCRECRGRGVVEATTTYGLEQAGDRTLDRLREMFGIEATDPDAVYTGIEAYDRHNLRIIYEQDAELRRLRAAMQSTINAAVALPEETPQ